MKNAVVVFLSCVLFGLACTPQMPRKVVDLQAEAPVFPAYESGTQIPCNIAPLNFTLPDTVSRVYAEVYSSSGHYIIKGGRSVSFSQRSWKTLTERARQGSLDTLTVKLVVHGQSHAWYAYPEIRWVLRPEPIDPYLTYRLVQPTANAYNVLEIRERCLENFSERVLVSNRLMNGNCFNCHTYHGGDANRMIIHLRKPSEGSLLFYDGYTQKVRLPAVDKALADMPDSLRMPLNFIYAAWHPKGDYIAFCTNIMGLSGYTAHRQYVDLLDSASNIILYHPQSNSISLPPALWTAGYEETWPTWSPDGKWLYFCRTPKPGHDTVMRYPEVGERVQHIFFDLCRVGFDAVTGRFSDTVQVVLKSAPGKSYSIPRVHPDGKYLLVCRGLFNSVPYHALGDLELVDLEKNRAGNEADILNSLECESWHEWSSNGFWVVFGSKRQDGHYALPYIAFFDGEKFGKPFVLPQRKGSFYQTNLRAYNLPTFTHNASKLNPRRAAQAKEAPVMEIGLR
ncbi:MAG: hypothetical protein NC048_01540 [Bacteroides sp.]|nr:hypothetical protein [Ruminococcus flavefaciens]MCM1554164.1 hypothetical protein [Bacteroides sp.]